MLACVDVHYRKDGGATAACILFEKWKSAAPSREIIADVEKVGPYIPGKFYIRELPCILKILNSMSCKPETIIVDGYVWLGKKKPGLGAHLYEAFKTPVIGVAKTPFMGADTAIPVLRGTSKKPLYVTAAGIEATAAAKHIASMAGEFRIPHLLKRLDQLTTFYPQGIM